MKKLSVIVGAVLLCLETQASERVFFLCRGADVNGNAAEVRISGEQNYNSRSKKTYFEVDLTIKAKRISGEALFLSANSYSGTKAQYGTLEQYGITLRTDIEDVSLVVNNKNSSVLSLYNPSEDESQEFSLSCSGNSR